MCVIWVKRHPEEAEGLIHPQDAATPPLLASPRPEPDVPTERVRTPRKRRAAPSAPDPTPAPKNENVYSLSRAGVAELEQNRHLLEHPELLTEEAVDALAQRGIEVTVKTASGVDVVLVPKYTKQDRCELSYRDARTLVMTLQVFPGATLAEITKPNQEEAS
jgi:hypothetical protein